MRISKRVSDSAYERTLTELAAYGVDTTKLPGTFYLMHWSERRRYIMDVLGLYQCPRCRTITHPENKHPRKQLCQACGDHTAHHPIYIDDVDSYVAPSNYEAPARKLVKPATSVDQILNRAKGDRNG